MKLVICRLTGIIIYIAIYFLVSTLSKFYQLGGFVQHKMSVETYMRAFLDHKKKLDDAEREGREATSEDTYDKEFTKLRELSQSYKTENSYPSLEGEKSCNIPKNRYKDIVPFDDTRVKLRNLKDNSVSDYINASFIRGAVGDQMYIAAQGPMPKTVCEFWQMLWENNVRVMFMACREYEGVPPKLKCQRYWPNLAENMVFGNIKVTLEREETTSYKEHRIRHMNVSMGDENRKVVQLHYQEWPDRGVPRCIPGILDLIEILRKYQPLNAKDTPPILVHCSAGCGRTGTILVIDFVQSLFKYGKLTEDFKLYDVIAKMRRQRMAIVQSLEQYIFVHEAIAELFSRHLQTITSRHYGNVDVAAHVTSGQVNADLTYEVVSSCDYDKPKPSSKPQTASKPKPTEFSELLGHPDKSPKSVNLIETSCSSLTSTCPAVKEIEYAEPFVSTISTKPAHPKAEVTVDVLTKKSTSIEARMPKSPTKVVQNKSEYAYADPYQGDKWSLQAIARGKEPDSTYASIDEAGYQEVHCDGNAYGEINPDAFQSKVDDGVPKIPIRLYQQDEISGLSRSKEPTIAQVIYRGVDISYPNRVGKPQGKRPVKMAPAMTVH